MALSLYGVTVHDVHVSDLVVAGVEMIAVRDLAALCGQTDYRGINADQGSVSQHVDILRSYAAHGPVLPAPLGVVFRSSDAIVRWLELHYGALTEALSFVENRVAARVHVHPPLEIADVKDAKDSDAIATANESLRTLRRSAVTMLPLRAGSSPGALASAAYLVEEQFWKEFVAEVEAQDKTLSDVRLDVTGPWPPYDFVQMQLGA